MKIKIIVIDPELSTRTKRILAAIAIPAVLLGGAAIAYASVPTIWQAGDTLNAADLNQDFAYVEGLASGAGDCPSGYTLDAAVTGFTVCTKGNDEVVKVGNGGSAFWIDRYEASVWSDAGGTTGAAAGKPWGTASADYPGTFPPSAQVTSRANLLFAVSRKGVTPSAYLTWFQANLACAAGGKRLPTSPEWLLAATGTPDPAAPSDGANGDCITQAAGVRGTGKAVACASVWGAQDMIGNLTEIVSEWSLSPGSTAVEAVWPAGFGGDATYYVASGATNDVGTFTQGLPAMNTRGGHYSDGVSAGVFSLEVAGSPVGANVRLGFRCATSR